MTVVVKAQAYYYDSAAISVSTSLGSQELVLDESMREYTVVLDCADVDAVILTSLENYASVRQVVIYAGEQVAKLRATEQGDAVYRLITGITGKSYTVTGLEAGGTYIYKVKALFADGTESPWSNIEQVTLFENGHGFALGDVDHDGEVAINDVSRLIDMLMGNDAGCCSICADIDEDGEVSIADVSLLIDMLLTN